MVPATDGTLGHTDSGTVVVAGAVVLPTAVHQQPLYGCGGTGVNACLVVSHIAFEMLGLIIYSYLLFGGSGSPPLLLGLAWFIIFAIPALLAIYGVSTEQA